MRKFKVTVEVDVDEIEGPKVRDANVRATVELILGLSNPVERSYGNGMKALFKMSVVDAKEV